MSARSLARDPRPWLALAAVSLVVWISLVAGVRTSPGALSAVHGRVAELEGAGACDACHGGWGTPLAEACGDCHEAALESVRAGRGLHGSLAEASDCGACHLEHHGPDHVLAGPLAFAAAGYESREDYDHAALDFELGGRHAELACDACHPAAEEALLPEGVQRFGALAQDCAGCHEDVHEGRLERGCAACHGQEQPFADVAGFVHRAVFPGSGAHAELACLDCHPAAGSHAIEVLDSAPPSDPRGCTECHGSPHAPGFAEQALALAGAVTPGDASGAESCELCHGVERGGFASPPNGLDPAWHAAAGFALEGPHADRSCEACHAPAEPNRDFAARHPGRAAEDCAACHADPHGDEFTRGPFAGATCLDCHADGHFVPAEFGPAQHALTEMALEGTHAELDCSACHAESTVHQGEQRRFEGLGTECADCHSDPHDGLFAAAADVGSDCATCHGSIAFHEVEGGAFDHLRWTGFALEAAHGRVDCAACHPRADEPDALGRRFGRAALAFGGPIEGCASCHADVHGGTFVERGESGADCATCHGGEAFAHVEAGVFDHGRWTGFTLDGAHGRADCGVCHPRAEQVDAQGRRFGRVTELFGPSLESCAACHADAHGGRFEGIAFDGRSGSDCAECHVTASFDQHGWGAPDHGLWTGYPLLGAHASAACEACHPTRAEPDAAGRDFGAARGAVCADCHADPHVGQFARQSTDRAGPRAAVDCAACHTVGADWSGLRFDHERDARFSLAGVHAAVDCGACHQPARLADGSRAVRYRPLGTDCRDCHAFGPDGEVR